MSSDVKWMIGVIVAAIVAIAIGIAAIMVSVAAPQFSRIAADMRHHEDRINASNNDVILELQRLFDGMRDEYRERMHGVEDVLHELRLIREGLQDGDDPWDAPSPDASRRRDLERALSNVEHALTALIRFRPHITDYVAQRLKEVRDELRAIRGHLDGGEESENGGGDGSEDDEDDGRH